MSSANSGGTETPESAPSVNSSDALKKSDFDPSRTGSSDNGDDNLYEVKRDPYFAFIPQTFKRGCNIVNGEVQTVTNAVTGFPAWSKQYGSDTFNFYRHNPRILYDEIISGFTVAIMQVPESIAFSFVAGVPPLSGLQATFWMATVTGLFGGKPGMISGAAGALAVVVTDLTADDGVLNYLSTSERLNVLYMTMLWCGVFQILFAAFRLAKLVRLIPETGMIGFMDGLAIIIFMAQLPAFQYCTAEPLFVQCSLDQRQWLTFQNNTVELILVLVHVFGCMAIMKLFPKIPKIGRIIPASLVALLVGTLIEHTLFRMAIGVGTRTVEETAPMSGDLPQFDWPAIPTDSNTVQSMFLYAITLAAIGSVESVLTLQACNEITDTVAEISHSNQELFAQGLANLICGIFRAMGGDAMIGQSTINIMNGARHRVSSTSSGIFMLLFIVALSPFIDLLPVATLTGVLFMVVLSTFQWSTFQILRYGRLSDSLVILIVTLVAVFMNLAVAIAAGIVFSALVYAWDSGTVDADIQIKSMIVNGEECDVKYVKVKGAIFFSSARDFTALFSVSDDPNTIIIDFKNALIIDHSAVAAIQGITHRFVQVGKRVLLVNLPRKSHGRLQRTGDHSTLKSQITGSSKLKESTISPIDEESPDYSAHIVGTQTNDLEESDYSAHIVGTQTDAPVELPGASREEVRPLNVNAGIADEGETLRHIPMLQYPVESVSGQLDHLVEDQPYASIHEKSN